MDPIPPHILLTLLPANLESTHFSPYPEYKASLFRDPVNPPLCISSAWHKAGPQYIKLGGGGGGEGRGGGGEGRGYLFPSQGTWKAQLETGRLFGERPAGQKGG